MVEDLDLGSTQLLYPRNYFVETHFMKLFTVRLMLVFYIADIPQWCETDNPLFGLTTNARNPAFTPGGSTGGEGALLSLRGSLVGWGTDIGGSIRIPSSINGLYGLKPSASTILPRSTSNTYAYSLNAECPYALSRSPGIYGRSRACAFCNWTYDTELVLDDDNY